MVPAYFERPLAALGSALVQSVWQTAVIALLAAAALTAFRRADSRVRYTLSGSALLLVVAAFCVEVYRAVFREPDRILAVVAAVWLAGAALLLIRVLGGWWLLRRQSVAPRAESWNPAIARLAERLHLTTPVAVVESAHALVPGLIGSRHPVIVLPSRTVATSSREDVEAILAHELGHVRRGDFAANALQTAVEHLFFFHPGVWWLSRQLRIERERCCDDLAASLFSEPVGYAEALVRLEERRTHDQRHAGGSAGSFGARVRRLIEAPPLQEAVSRADWLPVGVFGVAAVSMLVAVHSAPFALNISVGSPADLRWLTPPSLVMATLFGLLLGVRHACEPDHLLAVSTLLDGNKGARRAMRLGLSWGAGHTATLLAVGAMLALLHCELPAGVSSVFEGGVSLMLIGLGARAVFSSMRHGADGPHHSHSHGSLMHEHRGALDHVHVRRWVLAPRPLMVGMVHGLAGSGALAALVMANLPTVSAQIAYIALFGAGSAAGMAALSTLAGSPFARFARQRGMNFGLSCVGGVLSIAYGLWSGSPLLVHLLSK